MSKRHFAFLQRHRGLWIQLSFILSRSSYRVGSGFGGHVSTWSKPGIFSQLFPLGVDTDVTVARREEEEEEKNCLSKGRNLERILTLKFKVGGPELAPEKWGWREDPRTKSSNGSDECKYFTKLCGRRCLVEFRKMTEEKEQIGCRKVAAVQSRAVELFFFFF